MPFYDFRCNRCDTVFEVLATVEEMREGKIPCPGCGSRELTRVYQKANISFTSREAQAQEHGHCCCCKENCPHAGH